MSHYRNWIVATLIIAGSWFNAAPLQADGNTIPVSNFSDNSMTEWKPKIFNRPTAYTIVQQGDRKALKAVSRDSASGLYREIRIDLDKTPYLNWSWRIKNRLGTMDEKSQKGDDFSARVYVVISGGAAFWRTRALNYVWSANATKGDQWPNAFVGERAMMLALRSTSDATNQWFDEKRNVKNDLQALFGESIRYIDAVAIMTDSDNSDGEATAWYGDLYFSAQ